MIKLIVLKNYLDSKIDYIKQLFMLKNYSHGKTSYIENIYILKNLLTMQNYWNLKLFAL
jgi:hypothetical protein